MITVHSKLSALRKDNGGKTFEWDVWSDHSACGKSITIEWLKQKNCVVDNMIFRFYQTHCIPEGKTLCNNCELRRELNYLNQVDL